MLKVVRKLLTFILIAVTTISTIPLAAMASSTEWSQLGPSGAIINDLSISSDKTVFAATDTDGVYKLINGGSNFAQSGLSGKCVISITASPNYVADETIFAGTDKGIYVSTDKGATWNLSGLANNIIWDLAISPSFGSDHTVFAGTDSGLYRLTDNASGWSLVGPVDKADADINTIAISPAYSSDKTLFIATINKGFFKSVNQGDDDWQIIDESTGDESFLYLAISPDYETTQTIFADGLKSTNGGLSLESIGLDGLDITGLAISPSYGTDSTIFVGSLSKGVFVSKNGGASWKQLSSDITDADISAIALSPGFPQDGIVYIGTLGNGVFSYDTDTVPEIIGTDPVDAATGVPISKSVSVSFNRNIYEGPAFSQITLSTVGGSPVPSTIMTAGNVLTVKPISTLANSTGYSLTIPANAVEDAMGKILQSQHVVTFTTENAAPSGGGGGGGTQPTQDTSAPRVSATNPSDNATGVDVAADISVTFSEAINAGSNFNKIRVKDSDGNTVSAKRETSGKVLTINPNSSLSYGSQYTVTIPARSVKDKSDNDFASEYSFDFTTRSSNGAPVVRSTTPADGATNVDVNPTITITFDKNIKKGAMYDNISIKREGNHSEPHNSSYSNKELRLTPKSNLASGTLFTVTLPINSIKDTDDNSLHTRYTFSFRTRADSTAPAAPQNLKQTTNNNLIHLTWNKNSEADIDGYNVYRKIKGEASYKKLNSSLTKTISYTDKTGQLGLSYLYCVKAVDRSGNEGPASNDVEAALINVKGAVVFSDVPGSAWYTTYVNRLASLKILGGYSNGTFGPGKKITRAEFCKALVLAMGWQLHNPTTASFNDVPKGNWAYTYVETARYKGVIKDNHANKFRPNEFVTRAEIARMASAALNLSADSTALLDTKGHWARNQIGGCVKAGIISGYPNKTFKPDSPTTRAEACKIISIMMDKK
jgi:methionine-rich copper-binding protein CopC